MTVNGLLELVFLSSDTSCRNPRAAMCRRHWSGTLGWVVFPDCQQWSVPVPPVSSRKGSHGPPHIPGGALFNSWYWRLVLALTRGHLHPVKLLEIFFVALLLQGLLIILVILLTLNTGFQATESTVCYISQKYYISGSVHSLGFLKVYSSSFV